ncbi:MAG: arylsulfatase [Balneolaceae bacterium]|nr:arylsulfatase [Balneolaceae bacterium]
MIEDEDETLSDRPNIILIVADDLGYGDLGSFGQKYIQTPRLDKMAEEGMRLTDFYSGSTVCAPARSVLMTGQHTGRTLIRGNFPAVGGVQGIGAGLSRLPLREEDVTVAELLQDEGYSTALIGKWGLGEPNTTGTPNLKGFDYFFGFMNQRRAHSYHPGFIWRNHTRYDLVGNWDGARGQYTEDLFTSEAMAFIREQADTDDPFFLYLTHQVPHSEMWVPSESKESYSDKFDDPVAVYAGMVSRLDRNTGAVLDLLEELKLADNTLVIFISDNGTHSEGGYNPGPLNSSGPLRGQKRDLYEGGIRVPTIAWWPRKIEAGSESDHIADFADVMPTFAQLAVTDTPDNIDGISFLPTLFGQDEDQLTRALYWEFHERGFDQAGRRGEWKAVRKGHESEIELYNLKEDLGEKNNIADDHPEMIEWFEDFFVREREPSQYWPSPLD